MQVAMLVRGTTSPMMKRKGQRMSDDRCYECEGYGDDYYYDADTDEFVSACVDCPYNIANSFEDEW